MRWDLVVKEKQMDELKRNGKDVVAFTFAQECLWHYYIDIRKADQ